MTTQKQQAIENPASREFFLEALRDFEDNSAALRTQAAERWGFVQARQTAMDELREIEARLVTNGQVEGKNAGERAARLGLLMADDPGAKSVRDTIGHCDAKIWIIDAEADLMRANQASARYRMRYADATLRYLAGQQATEPYESEE